MNINSFKSLIAHRGESYDAPENTLSAINLAWERGAMAVEIDIRLTKDKEIVVIHDKDTARISDKKLVVKKSIFKALSLLDVGKYKNEKYSNERIPRLKDVLKTVPKAGKIIIEIKSDERILPVLKGELNQSELEDSQIEIIDFNLKTLAKAKDLMPNYKMLWLLNLDYYWPWWLAFVNKKRIIKKVKRHKLNGINVWAGSLLDSNFIQSFKNSGLLVYCWTVNNPLQAKLLINTGIDGITTDRAEWMNKELSLD